MKHALVAAAALLVVLTLLPASPEKTGPVADALRKATRADRQTVAGIYAALADITERDAGKLIPTTAVWRKVHADSLRLAVGGTDLVGRYPGLDNAVEQVMAAHVSLDNVAMDAERVAALAKACRAVESQCE